jgi:hypothetical protein
MRWRAVVGTCACALAACTLTTNLDGLSGGANGADAGDAGGGPDAPADAPLDAAAEAATDASSSSDAGGTWCAQQDSGYRLCSDFDRPNESVTQGFDLGLTQATGAGGTFQLDTSSFVSPPSSAVGHANAFGAKGSTGAYLSGNLWVLGAPPATLACSVQWSPIDLSSVQNDWAHVVTLAVYSDAGEQNEIFDFNIKLLSDGTLALDEIYEGSGPEQDVRHLIPASIKAGSWYPIAMSLTNSSGATSYSVTVGGIAAPGGTLTHALAATSHGTFRIGPAYYEGTNTAPSPGWTFRYDDVVCY